jgi:deazaflavin-dependent oxidoreductase (nitroreductase family)
MERPEHAGARTHHDGPQERAAPVGDVDRDDTHPAWFLNLRDKPDVQVALEGQPKRPYTAHIADAAERARLWPKIVADHKNYAGYQKKTDREIPVVVLKPVTG